MTNRVRTFTLVLVCVLALSLAAMPASAGDGSVSVYFQTEEESSTTLEIDADSGDTIELEIVMSAHSDLRGQGIDELAATVEYNTSVFTVTEADHGPMLASGDSDAEIDGSLDVDDDTGQLLVDQERTPSGDGATGNDPFATLTLEVAEDAEVTTETLEVTDSSASSVRDYPRSVFDNDAIIHVEGGADESDDEGDDDDDGPEGVTLGDGVDDDTNETDDTTETDTTESASNDADSETDSNETSEESSNGTSDAADDATAGDDSVPGFAIPGALIALAVWLGLLIRAD
ncbi:cohesin domain-containing protein [Natronolimnobius sp. AArcel1]|uniref:cohesin domain-containing protein n=1 Tax=Natronolimnobius sp. AArcel1 TaxID=1679093 RepID=UPI0013EE1309|nr:cohesin domain-containing protein [Natronolimnobius sp. AArcel1]NGM70901.1 cohesin domain-containing protein [Natronolimnobius sp. AArcel1]